LTRAWLVHSFLARSGTNQRTGIHDVAAWHDCSRPGEVACAIICDGLLFAPIRTGARGPHLSHPQLLFCPFASHSTLNRLPTPCGSDPKHMRRFKCKLRHLNDAVHCLGTVILIDSQVWQPRTVHVRRCARVPVLPGLWAAIHETTCCKH
jgi:hypothetical protein